MAWIWHIGESLLTVCNTEHGSGSDGAVAFDDECGVGAVEDLGTEDPKEGCAGSASGPVQLFCVEGMFWINISVLLMMLTPLEGRSSRIYERPPAVLFFLPHTTNRISSTF
jgi:hypothetical protein